MPIEKGEDWGSAGQLPPGAPVATSDAEVAALVGGEHPVIGLDNGDLARTLGVRKPYDPSSPKQLLAIDAVRIGLDDGKVYTCVAHAVIGSLLRHSRSAAVMNAAFVGKRNVAPRAHPGDGKVDVVTLRLVSGDRVKAWRRMVTGSHVPHPGIEVRRHIEGVVDLGRRLPVRIDGQPCGRSTTLSFTVIPEALVIAVS